ncbi:hypothetical protein B0H13DRAFT_1568836, partial [Mycena leptocephala]
FSPNDLDFFTPRGKGDQVIKFLDLAGGYKVVRQTTEYEDATAIGRVSWLQTDGSRMKINVIESLTDSPYDTVTAFHSTAVMNAWTGHKIWIAYPDLTLHRSSITTPHLMPLPEDDLPTHQRAWKVLNKYTRRGYFFLLDCDIPHIRGVDYNCPATLRRTDDPGCLSIRF